MAKCEQFYFTSNFYPHYFLEHFSLVNQAHQPQVHASPLTMNTFLALDMHVVHAIPPKTYEDEQLHYAINRDQYEQFLQSTTLKGILFLDPKLFDFIYTFSLYRIKIFCCLTNFVVLPLWTLKFWCIPDKPSHLHLRILKTLTIIENQDTC